MMNRVLNCGVLSDIISKNYNRQFINNTDFIIDLYLRLKLNYNIKSVVKQGWINGKSILYLQLKNKIDIIHIYFIDEHKQLCITSIDKSDILESRNK